MQDNPWRLLLSDFAWLFSNLYDVIVEFIIRNSILAIRFDELNNDAPRSELNLCYFDNWISVFAQIGLLIITLPVFIFYPLMMTLAMEPEITDYIRPPKRDDEHADEKWFFVNGVLVNKGWLDENCKYLEARFNRGVTGILNRSYGVIWDFVEVILGRSFEIDTTPVLLVSRAILKELRDDKIKTVRLIAHSQGTIITNLALKRIYLDLSYNEEQNLLKKLEVFTFANACREFVNPGRLISRIEHYANKLDPVAKIGVLNKENNGRFQGEIFVNSERNEGKGHLFNTYYSLNAGDYAPMRPNGASPQLLSREGSVPNLPIDIIL